MLGATYRSWRNLSCLFESVVITVYVYSLSSEPRLMSVNANAVYSRQEERGTSE
jgi:hypothetical protein